MKTIEVPTPEELAKFLVKGGEKLPEVEGKKLREQVDEKAFSQKTYRRAVWLMSWLGWIIPCFLTWMFSLTSLTDLMVVISFFWGFIRLIIAGIEMTDPYGRSELCALMDTIADKLRSDNLDRKAKAKSLTQEKFQEYFSSDAAVLHAYYDKWKKAAVTKDVDERTILEKAVSDISNNVQQLKKPGVGFDQDVRRRELANFESLLEKLKKRLEAVREEEVKCGDSLDEQIARQVLLYMTKEERPLLHGDEDGSSAVAEMELALTLDGPLPDLSPSKESPSRGREERSRVNG